MAPRLGGIIFMCRWLVPGRTGHGRRRHLALRSFHFPHTEPKETAPHEDERSEENS